MENMVEVAGWKIDSCDDGPGVRSVLFLQGCRKNCPGCQNAQTHKRGEGKWMNVLELCQEAEENCCGKRITISGGEPLEQLSGLMDLLHGLRHKGFDICLYTGWNLDEVPREILFQIDYLKVGSFEVEKKDAALQYVGSWNQHFYRVKKGLLFEVNIGHTLCA